MHDAAAVTDEDCGMDAAVFSKESGMLILTRSESEEVVLQNKVTGDLIRVMLVRIKPDGCRLGFAASGDWSILRSELVGKQPRAGGRGSPEYEHSQHD